MLVALHGHGPTAADVCGELVHAERGDARQRGVARSEHRAEQQVDDLVAAVPDDDVFAPDAEMGADGGAHRRLRRVGVQVEALNPRQRLGHAWRRPVRVLVGVELDDLRLGNARASRQGLGRLHRFVGFQRQQVGADQIEHARRLLHHEASLGRSARAP